MSKNVLHQESHNALKIFLECFSLVESIISPPELMYKMFKGRILMIQAYRWPQVVIFGPFQSLPLQGEKIFDHQI